MITSNVNGNTAPWTENKPSTIHLTLPSGPVSITDCARQLFGLIAPRKILFTRGGSVVRLVAKDDGANVLELMRPAAARSFFEKFAKLFAWRVGRQGRQVLQPATCPLEMADALLQTAEAQSLLPRVTGLINSPIIREANGTLEVVGPGYDPATGMLVTGGKTPPEVNLEEAVASLTGLLEEFDFQTPGDKSRALAGLIAPALKLGGLLRGGVPADVAEADQSQSGKTYRQKIAAAIYGEKVSLITNRQGGVGSVDESLSQRLIAGRPFIQLDNFRGRLASQHLEAFLTAESSFGCRVPHREEVDVQPERFFLMLTSNGVDTTRDFANRSSIVRIKKKPAGYHFRTYPEGDLLAHVPANQAHCLGCVFAVVREWYAQGMPRTDETRHDFREWCQVLDWIVQHIFKASPLMDGHQQAQERVSNPALVWLRAVALVVAETDILNQELTATEIVELCEGASIPIPGSSSGADEDKAKRVVGTVLSKLFGSSERLDVDTFVVQRSEKQVPRDGGGRYSVKVYTIVRKPAGAQSQPPPDASASAPAGTPNPPTSPASDAQQSAPSSSVPPSCTAQTATLGSKTTVTASEAANCPATAAPPQASNLPPGPTVATSDQATALVASQPNG